MEKDVLNAAEVSEYLDLSQSIVRRLVKNKQIPYIKIKGRYLFYLPSIREWLASLTTKAENANWQKEEEEAKKIAREIWENTVRK